MTGSEMLADPVARKDSWERLARKSRPAMVGFFVGVDIPKTWHPGDLLGLRRHKRQEPAMGGTELKTDSLQRWMMYSKDAHGSGRIFLTTEQKQAVEEGKKFAQRAYTDVWAKDAQLVKRVRTFLGQHFYWHDRLAKTGTDLEVIETLQSMIRGESVVLIAEQSRTDGTVAAPTPKPQRLPSFRESLMTSYEMSYEAATDYIERYNASVDRINAALAQSANTAASAQADDASGFTDTATPLGDAQPFEYAPYAVGGDAEQIAGMPFHGAPGSWVSSIPGTMPQLRQYGPSGTPMTDIDFEAHHGNANPHAHNWDGTSRDHGWPVSILP
jgi:hypothetical protein